MLRIIDGGRQDRHPYGLKFGPRVKVKTSVGERWRADAPATQEFWNAWGIERPALMARGYGCGQDEEGNWWVHYYQLVRAEDKQV